MRHKVKKNRLGRQRGHLHLMLRNLATSILLYEKVKTTEAKAKAVRPIVEKLVGLSKKENIYNAIRQINSIVLSKGASKKLMEYYKERFKNKTSGYTRITPVKYRTGDNAKLVLIEMTEGENKKNEEFLKTKNSVLKEKNIKKTINKKSDKKQNIENTNKKTGKIEKIRA